MSDSEDSDSENRSIVAEFLETIKNPAVSWKLQIFCLFIPTYMLATAKQVIFSRIECMKDWLMTKP